ncbi:hypothetical protein [Ruegeria atlantica]|uniref:hypothetical protein n=1 Tax=Ruegeria atlantica TaxID=81569 RepID=UPI0014801DF0|nr:hypothetical protein [Ruegeria atlantica]
MNLIGYYCGTRQNGFENTGRETDVLCGLKLRGLILAERTFGLNAELYAGSNPTAT